MANEFIQKDYAGAAVATTLAAGVSGSAATLTVAAGSTYPDGSTGPFVIAIARGTGTEEKVIIQSRSGNTLTVLGGAAGRGYDGSTAQAQVLGATVEHVMDAYSIKQANAFVNTPTTRGDIVVRNASGNPQRLGVGAAGTVLKGGTDPSYGQIGNAEVSNTAAIAYGKLALTGSIVSADLVDGTVTGTDIAAGTITSANIQDATITGTDIAAGTITTGNIQDGTILGTDIAAGTIATGNILDGTILGTDIASETITSANILNGTIADADLANVAFTNVKSIGGYPHSGIATRAGTNQAIASGAVVTALALNSEIFDTSGLHSTVSNNHRIAIAAAGFYLITLNVSWETGTIGGATGYRLAQLRRTNSGGTLQEIIGSDARDAGDTASSEEQQSIVAFVKCNVGDLISAHVAQTSGGSLGVLFDDPTNLNCTRMGWTCLALD